MAIIISNPLESKYENFRTQMTRLDDRCNGAITDMAAGNVDSEALIALYRYLTQVNQRLDVAAAIPGVAQYAKDYEGNQSYDLLAEITALQTALASTLSWIEVNFPKSGDWLLFLKIVNGVIVPRSFTPTQTATLRTQLQVVVDAIG